MLGWSGSSKKIGESEKSSTFFRARGCGSSSVSQSSKQSRSSELNQPITSEIHTLNHLYQPDVAAVHSAPNAQPTPPPAPTSVSSPSYRPTKLRSLAFICIASSNLKHSPGHLRSPASPRSAFRIRLLSPADIQQCRPDHSSGRQRTSTSHAALHIASFPAHNPSIIAPGTQRRDSASCPRQMIRRSCVTSA